MPSAVNFTIKPLPDLKQSDKRAHHNLDIVLNYIHVSLVKFDANVT
jgi:hypothetical protein